MYHFTVLHLKFNYKIKHKQTTKLKIKAVDKIIFSPIIQTLNVYYCVIEALTLPLSLRSKVSHIK